MTTIKVLADQESTADAELVGGRVLVAPAELPRVLGWTLKPQPPTLMPCGQVSHVMP